MKDRLFASWNFTRLLRLALGIFIIFQGVHSRDWLFVAIGGVFTLLPLMNIGGCGVAGCAVPPSNTKNDSTELEYEEVRK